MLDLCCLNLTIYQSWSHSDKIVERVRNIIKRDRKKGKRLLEEPMI